MQSQVKRRIVFGLTTGGLLATGGAGMAHADASAAGVGDGTTTAGSPGILSGNTVQVPVDVPINVCGVTANVVGLLNPAAGNHCSNSGGASAGGASAGSTGGASASGSSVGSPGILSGNTVQAPVHVPVNVCGDTVNVVGVGNSAHGNHCVNAGGSATGGSTATGTSVGSPGIGSGNTIQLPISIPVNLCGDSVNVVGVGNGAEGNSCANNTPVPPTTPTPPPTVTPGSWVAPHTSPTEAGGSVPAAGGMLAHTGADGLMLAPIGAALMGGGAFMYRRYKPGRSN